MTNQNQRKSFIIHKDSLDILDQLDDEQAGKLFKAIFQYQKTGEIESLDQFTKIILTPFISQFKRDEDKWLNVVERNKANIAKRWNTKNTTGKTGIPKDTKNTDSDSKSDSKSGSDSDSKNELSSEGKFESFWNIYGKKLSRPDAEKKFKAALKKDTFENIIAGLERYIKARGSDPQYWKHPSTWLNQECWKDEYQPKQEQKPTQSSGSYLDFLTGGKNV